jgi:hypothetical protein
VDEIDNSLERIRVGGWKNAMAKVEDVARPGAGSVKDAASGRVEDLCRGEGEGGIEIALQGNRITDSSTSFIEGNSPVNAHDVCARGCHEAQEFSGSDAEQGSRNAEIIGGIHDGLRGGKGEALILRRTE